MTAPIVFPREEFAERLRRSREAFVGLDVDAVVVLAARNWYRDHAVRYLTGYDCPTSPTVLLVPMQGDPILVVQSRDEAERAAEFPTVQKVRLAEDAFVAVVDWLSAHVGLKRLGLGGGECMGFSALDVLPRQLNALLRERCPGVEIVDVGGVLAKIRSIRSDREIAALREAARLADVGADAFLATMRAGISERDVWSEIWYAMQCAGAADVHMSMCCGPRSFWPHPPSDAVFAPGDVVSVELSPRIGGYFSQSNRMCFVGTEGREWRELSQLANEALALAVAAVRPGAAARDVVKEVSAFVGKTQTATMDVGGVHRIGHGCGISIDEAPFLTSSSTEELQPNMTMALHPIMYLPYRHSILMLGDYVRVTDRGAEVMSTPQGEIPVV
jgi:Xaa-Pro aminopeptidase